LQIATPVASDNPMAVSGPAAADRSSPHHASLDFRSQISDCRALRQRLQMPDMAAVNALEVPRARSHARNQWLNIHHFLVEYPP
jgi:hypothetical protein